MGIFQDIWEGSSETPPNREQRRARAQERKRESRRATRAYHRRLTVEQKGAKNGTEG